MLLRKISQHVKAQDWFAVVLDFIIVILGILIAFQITNWNEARQSKVVELRTLEQIEIEFTEIRNALLKQIEVRKTWVADLGMLILTLEGNAKLGADDAIIRAGLGAATNTGRQPASSAAYLQLMASGDLTLLSSEPLKLALVNYHTRLNRDAFVHPALTNLVMEEMASNHFIDRHVLSRSRGRAAIDDKAVQINSAIEIKSYQIEGLKTFENRYETMYTLHIILLATEELQLEIANEVLKLIERGRL
jgi:hypothetical protein